MHMNLVSIFGDTVKKYRTMYKDATDELEKNGTFVHAPGSLSFDKQPFTGTVKVIDTDTVSAGIQYAYINDILPHFKWGFLEACHLASFKSK